MTKSYLNRIDPQRIVETATALERRIGERFPKSRLREQAHELVAVAQGAAKEAAVLGRRSILWYVLLCILLASAGYFGCQHLHGMELKIQVQGLADLVQTLDSATNVIILGVGGIYFLFSLGVRRKRHRALKALHLLRSMAHIVDLVQLQKDPDRLHRSSEQNTESSPRLQMNEFELKRYLDYCIDMLSVIGKIAALYAERLHDPVALESVGDVEALTGALSTGIHHKLVVLSAPDGALESK